MKTDGSNAQSNKPKPADSMRGFIASQAAQIKTALPQNITPERMCRIAMTAITRNPKLAECTPQSFMGALLTSAQLGLECNTPLGQAYLIPYNNKGILETEFQLGYQGTLDLCYRTKMYKTIQARIVYKGDDFDYSYGFEEKLIHRPREKSNVPQYVYAYYELINGAKSFEVMTWDGVMDYAKKYSKAVQNGYSSPWKTDPEGMAKKTLLKKVLKYAPKTVEVSEAIAQDSAIIKTGTLIQDDEGSYLAKEVTNIALLPESAQEEAPKVEAPAQKPIAHTKPVNAHQQPTNQESLDDEDMNEALNRAFDEQADRYDSNVPQDLF